MDKIIAVVLELDEDGDIWEADKTEYKSECLWEVFISIWAKLIWFRLLNKVQRKYKGKSVKQLCCLKLFPSCYSAIEMYVSSF